MSYNPKLSSQKVLANRYEGDDCDDDDDNDGDTMMTIGTTRTTTDGDNGDNDAKVITMTMRRG